MLSNKLYIIKTINDGDFVFVDDYHFASVIRDGSLFEVLKFGKHKLNKKSKDEIVQILFMPKLKKYNMLWGTKNQFVYIEKNKKFSVGLNGAMDVRITNHRKFFSEVLISLDIDEFDKLIPEIRQNLCCQLDGLLLDATHKLGINFDTLEENRSLIAKTIRSKLNKFLGDKMGLQITSFNILGFIVKTKELEMQNDNINYNIKEDNVLENLETKKIKENLSNVKEIEEKYDIIESEMELLE